MHQPADADGDDRADGRPAGDAERVGFRERVAEDHLETRARKGERTAGQQREDDARQAQFVEDEGIRLLRSRGVGTGERVAARPDKRQKRGA